MLRENDSENLQVIIEIDSTVFSILIGFAVLLELMGIALGKKE